MNEEMAMVVRRTEEREALRGVIQQWNANRLDLFELSEPNEDLEFHGVMRFYFQDSGQKVATKCIRVASDATTQVVIETLIEKFRPDMRMLSIPEYALYEIHENGDERRLSPDEKPLLVQLNWHKDDREGRFLLRRIDDKTNYAQMPEGTFHESGSNFRRKLSKREKKQLKKQEKLNRMKSTGGIGNEENDAGVAEKLYSELPETSFTRSISNPEAVMRRRRQQKLERKLQQFRSKDGGPDTGGTLKIYGEALCKDVPYKTLLLSVGDTAAQVVKEMLNKYGLDKEEPHNYCLLQVNTGIDDNKDSTHGNNNTINNREYILDDDECPLAILMNHPLSRGSIMFHVRRRPADYHPRKRKKKPQQPKWDHLPDYRYEDDRLPFLLELNPVDNTEVGGGAKRYRLQPNVTEVGSEVEAQGHGQCLHLIGPNVQPRHCVIAHTEGIVTVTPCSRDAETYVNGQRIYETTILQNGATVKFGRVHNFRFLDPCHDERMRQRHDSSRSPHDYSYDRQSTREETSSLSVGNGPTTSTPSGNPLNYETTFDVDGNVETRSTSSQGNKDETRSQRSVSSSRDGNRISNYDRYPRGNDPILPAVLEIREETEEALLHAIVSDLDPSAPGFKLAPAYTLYLAARYRASTHYRPELTPTERAHRLTLMLARVAAMIHNVIQERYCEVKWLALWLANASELLHFLKSDRHISAFSLDAQDTLADAVQIAFRHLVACLQGELSSVMPNFLSDRDDLSHDPEDSSTASVLGVLSSAMALLRRCRVNAALTIQLFSQLFHYVNVWAFNRVVAPNSVYCSRAWGLRLKARLAQIEVWAERQGLELAADCHLARIMQAAHLLQAPKYSCDDLATLSSTCFKLNSLQLRALLQKYQPTPDEPRIPHDIIDNVVRVAENLADELARSDGREVRLEEDPELALPFLLPEDGYSCEVVRGVPPGLVDFVAPLQHSGLCRLTAQPTSNGLWTVYMGPANTMTRSPSAMSNRSGGFIPTQQEPEMQIIKLHKSNNGMGLSIVAAKGAGQDRLGIYIKSVVKGGAADADGRLQAGDQLLKVDGQSLVGITQEKAAEYLVRTGPVVTLEVAKQGAIYHGLATLLSQPSPVMGRASSSNFIMGSEMNMSLEGPAVMFPVSGLRENSHDFDCYHSSQILPPRPGSPTVLRINVPIIKTTPPPPENEHPPAVPTTNLLSVPGNTVKCYKISPGKKLDLKEDIFQQHQARLVNCDSEDAFASLQRIIPGSMLRKCDGFDVIRYRRTCKDHEPLPKWFYRSLESIKAPKDANTCWVPLKNSKSWKSDIYLSRNGEWQMFPTSSNHYSQKSDYSHSVQSIAEKVLSSSSECDCDSGSYSPQSTESKSDDPSPSKKHVTVQTINPESKFRSETNDKLTSEECERALRELDEIVSGVNKITEFGTQNLTQSQQFTSNDHNNMNNFLSSMLNLNISPIKCSDMNQDTATVGETRYSFSSTSSNEGDFEYGCGRVAELAKHFNRLGDAGIIKESTSHGKLKTKEFCKSDPNINSACIDEDATLSPSRKENFDSVISSKSTYAMGLSMDSLVDIGHGVIIRKVINGFTREAERSICSVKDSTSIDQMQFDKMDLNDKDKVSCNHSPQSYLMDGKTFNLISDCDTSSIQKNNNLYNGHFKINGCEPVKKSTSHKIKMLDLSKKSISVDEIEMKKRVEGSNLLRHYSLVDLGDIDDIHSHPKEIQLKQLDSFDVSKVENKFCSSEKIQQTYVGTKSCRNMKRWMSADDSVQVAGWEERLKEKEKLDLGSKDALRRLIKGDAIKGRKIRRLKKLEFQRSFVLSPLKNRQMSAGEVNCGTLYSLDEPSGQSDLDKCRPRRMSERDLPSRVLSEQQNQMGRGQLPPHAPQIQSSKSVPSLNTGNHELDRSSLNQTVIGNNTVPRPNYEVFNPGYSRTSSTNSIPQKAYEGQANANQIRSRSSQNLTEPRSNTLPPNNIGPRHPSNPNLMPNNHPNPQQIISMQHQQQSIYQQSPTQHPNMTHTHPQNYQQHPIYQQHVHQQQIMMQQQNSPVGDNGERFYQNLSIYRNQETHNGYLPNSSVGRGKMPSPQDERNSQVQKNLRGSQSSLQSRATEAITSRDRPASAYLPPASSNFQNQLPPQGMQNRSQSSRDMLRQEAKLQEMTEEVRRREMRSPQHRPQMGPVGPIQQSPMKYPGPGNYGEGVYTPPRLPHPAEYTESPPPPPPPPASTHPLYQHQGRTDNRYAASVGEPPRGGYYPTSPVNYQQRQYTYQGTNPWQREEREKEAERRRDAARQWRDQQINELSSLGHRSAQQEERLQALKLEREFERRAEEAEEEEEEDQETSDRVQGLLRVAQQNDERRSIRTPQPPQGISSPPNQIVSHSSPMPHPSQVPQYSVPPLNQPNQQSQLNGIINRTISPNATYAQVSTEEKARLQRLKELKIKQAEVEAERKKKDDELRNQAMQQHQNIQQRSTLSGPNQTLNRNPPTHLRLDNLVINTPATNNHYHNNNGYGSNQASPAGQRLDTLVGNSNGPPQPPERGSSFAVMSQAQNHIIRTPPPSVTAVTTPSNNTTTMATAKRVSFQDASPPSPSNNPPLENIREDPNNFINEAETMLASPVSPDTQFTGNTPGVIGAQEVYKDPRQRRLAEQQHQKLLSNKVGPVPEKLSFKEKMKMFAMETGEDGTPKDKVKISRAQRDIDNIGSPTTPNNNTSAQGN